MSSASTGRPAAHAPLAATAGLLLQAAGAHAQALPSSPLNPVVVTAARAAQPESQALGDVTVIDADTIARAGQSSLADLLQREAGVDVANNGGPQTTTSVFLRGANSGQTVFLIDGQRVGSSSAGGAGINALTLADIERIEILRGPASGLYGADAIGGVINIITRRPAQDVPLQAAGSIGFGSWNTRRIEGSLSGSQQRWSYGLSVGRESSDGFSATKPANRGGLYNPDRDGYTRDTVSARLGFAWADGQDLQASYLHARLNGRYDNSAGFDDRAIQTIEAATLRSNNRINDWWTSHLSVARTVDDNVSEYEPVFDSGYAPFRTAQNLFTWQNDLKLGSAQTLSLAAERRMESVESSTPFDRTRRTTDSLTGVYRADFGRHHLQGNLRYDHVEQYGGRTTGGLFYGFDLAPAWQVTLAGNTGFRLPTFNDLYYPIYGNPNLSPETSRNVEAGLRYRRGGTQGSLTVYRNKIENLIQYQTNAAALNKDATIKGLTLRGSQRWGATTVRGSLDLMDAKDDNTGRMLTRRPHAAFKFAADHRIGRWRMGAEWLLSGYRMDDAFNASTFDTDTVRLGGYSVMNLVASYDVTRNTQVQLRWNNIGDKRYELIDGYSTPGSNVFVTLTYRPN